MSLFEILIPEEVSSSDSSYLFYFGGGGEKLILEDSVIARSKSISSFKLRNHIIFINPESETSEVYLKNITISDIVLISSSVIYVNTVLTGRKVVIEGCTFMNINNEKVDDSMKSNGTAVKATVNGGVLDIQKCEFTNVKTENGNGGAVYCVESGSGEFDFVENNITDCEANGGEGGGVYLMIEEDCSENYKFHNLKLSYTTTTSNSIIFINYPDLFMSATSITQFVEKYECWDVTLYGLNSTNGIGYNRNEGVIRSYPLTFFFEEYLSNTIYITNTSLELPSYDAPWCGRELQLPCSSIVFGKTRLISATSGTVTNKLIIIKNIDLPFLAEEVIRLKDLTLTSNETTGSAITVGVPTLSETKPIISYEGALKIEKIKFLFSVNSPNKYSSFISMFILICHLMINHLSIFFFLFSTYLKERFFIVLI
jgi:hypothetical protein